MRLLVFTRYPEAGSVKTRLIPALGERGAAEIHKKMTEDTVKTASLFCGEVEVHFSGGNQKLMQDWLGNRLGYRKQKGSCLGEKLGNSFHEAFNEGLRKVVVIGSDCPELNVGHLDDAFSLLDKTDLVLGPALDGGYYLIGLRKYQPELFNNIDWGSRFVFQQTMKIAERLGLKTAKLEKLADIDLPEDLASRHNCFYENK